MRIFIAIKLPSEAVENLEKIQSRLKYYAERGHFVPPQNFHLTVRFLGEAPPSAASDIQSEMGFAAKFSPLEMSLQHMAAFGQSVVAVKLKAPKELFDLERELSSRLDKLGFPPENRRFTPHVTLLRDYSFGLPFAEIAKNIAVFNKPFIADELCLFETKFNRFGPVTYLELFSVKLSK